MKSGRIKKGGFILIQVEDADGVQGHIVPKCWGDFAVEQQGVGSDRFPQHCSYSDAKTE